VSPTLFSPASALPAMQYPSSVEVKGPSGVPSLGPIILIVDASAYFLSRGWLRIETKPTPPPAICAMRSHSLLTHNVRGSYDNTYSQIVLLNPW
jgi:hypothetical protein